MKHLEREDIERIKYHVLYNSLLLAMWAMDTYYDIARKVKNVKEEICCRIFCCNCCR